MPVLVDDPRLERMENLVEACAPVARRKNPNEADFEAAEKEVARMANLTDRSEEWYHLASRFGRYKAI
jgi:hypothetical protein